MEAMAKRITEFMPKARLEETTVLRWDEAEMLSRVAASKDKVLTKKIAPPSKESGPLPERLAKANNHYHVGDDQRGGKIYQLCDNPLDRLYSRLTRGAGSRDEDGLRREYAALLKYRNHWHSAGLEPSMGSVDLNRVFASDTSNMSGMAKTERQFNHRDQYRKARDIIGHRMGIVLDNVICAEWSLEIAGYSVGYGSYKQGRKTYSSPYRAREEATKLLRGAAVLLAVHWGFT